MGRCAPGGGGVSDAAWGRAVTDLDEALALVDAALAGRDWNRLAGAGWTPPPVTGAPGPAAESRLSGLALKLAELRGQVEAELAGVQAELSDLADRRRAHRAYLAGEAGAT